MKNLMIDLETMGNKPSSPIVAIGAVFFEPETGTLGEQFYVGVKLESAMQLGCQPDASTILWWIEQSREAQEAITSSDNVDIKLALGMLCDFVYDYCESPKYLSVWGNGAAFDNVILRNSYELAGIKAPWNWHNDLDVRTVVKMGRAIGFDPKRDMPFDGERHNALADAVHQAKYVSVIWQKLAGGM